MTRPAAAAQSASVQRIAVVRPNHRLGNTLLLTPLVQELEARFPAAQIELVTACGDAAAAFECYPRARTSITFPTHSYRHPLRVLGLLLKLRHRRFDLAIDPIPRSRAGRFLLGWIRARERIGFRWGVAWRDHALTRAVEASGAPRHFAQAPLYLLRSAYDRTSLSDPTAAPAEPPLRVPLPSLTETRASAPDAAFALPMDLRLTEAERHLGEERLAAALRPASAAAATSAQLSGAARAADRSGGPTLAVFAHASGSKGFPIEWWRLLIDAVRRRVPDVRVLEIVPADRLPRLAGDIPGLYTPEIRLLAATLAACSLVVIPDGGVMHVAEAAGARVLGLFKTTDPSQYGPIRSGSEGLWAPNSSAEAVAERVCALLRQPRELRTTAVGP